MSRTWLIGTALGMGLLVTHGFGLSLAPAMLPYISDSLGGAYAALATALGFGLAAYAIGALSVGRLLERLPVRPLLLATFLIPSVALLVIASARSAIVVGVAAAVMGANAGVSWPASLHALSVTIPEEERTTVMSAAGSGVGLGLIVNGMLVLLADGSMGWSGAVRIAALVGIIPVVMTILAVPSDIAQPDTTESVGSFRAPLRTPIGRVIALAGLAGGLIGFPVLGFMSVVASETFGASATGVTMLWVITGLSGIVVSPLVGRLGQRRTPLFAMIVGAIAFAVVLFVFAAWWNYVMLAMTAAVLTLYYYPVWGLSGAIADQAFDRTNAVRAVSLGLVGAAVGGSIGNTAAGHWFDATDSFREPIILAGVGMLLVVVVFARTSQPGRGASQPPTMRPTNVREGS